MFSCPCKAERQFPLSHRGLKVKKENHPPQQPLLQSCQSVPLGVSKRKAGHHAGDRAGDQRADFYTSAAIIFCIDSKGVLAKHRYFHAQPF